MLFHRWHLIHTYISFSPFLSTHIDYLHNAVRDIYCAFDNGVYKLRIATSCSHFAPMVKVDDMGRTMGREDELTCQRRRLVTPLDAASSGSYAETQYGLFMVCQRYNRDKDNHQRPCVVRVW